MLKKRELKINYATFENFTFLFLYRLLLQKTKNGSYQKSSD
ncbi:hypothetical protein LEP1GSC109_0677 [Leptospira interrogans str. UI 13372]|nr:hypothetical protein LEP1GSC109_0677 [Leptospira interrogans str. UI 13372]